MVDWILCLNEFLLLLFQFFFVVKVQHEFHGLKQTEMINFLKSETNKNNLRDKLSRKARVIAGSKHKQ